MLKLHKLHKPDVGNHFGKQVSKVLADMLQVEVLQATIIGVMKEDHDYHHLRLGQCGITVILSLFPRLYRVFCHLCIKTWQKSSAIQ